MKAVLISIQPKWCELIASGRKTVEVRKTKPKLETPFKCYIYCTQNGKNLIKDDISTTISFIAKNSGKVIGEFVCDKIVPLVLMESGGYYIPYKEGCGRACMTVGEAKKYGKGKPLYAWHISDLVIYDKPKELREFKQCHKCEYYANCYEHEYSCDGVYNLIRPPQSWCYVEELKGE